jgi:transcription initiation factor TFIIIB Brf1 subunit/transcription initiation factor TFIIB
MSDFDIFDQLDSLHPSPEEEEKEVPSSECLHEHVSDDGCGICLCDDCGVEIRKQTSTQDKINASDRCWAPKKKVRSIREDIKGMGFPDPVINEAEEIFKTVTKESIFRVERRKAIIVACLFEAYRMLKIPITLETLLAKVPIGSGNITTGMKLVETQIKKYDTDRSRNTYNSPVDSILDIMSNWDKNSDTTEEIIELYKKVENKSQVLNRSRSKSVAAGVIYYYALATKRTNIKLKEFSNRVELSESTIVKISKEISAILQTPEVLSYSSK